MDPLTSQFLKCIRESESGLRPAVSAVLPTPRGPDTCCRCGRRLVSVPKSKGRHIGPWAWCYDCARGLEGKAQIKLAQQQTPNPS